MTAHRSTRGRGRRWCPGADLVQPRIARVARGSEKGPIPETSGRKKARAASYFDPSSPPYPFRNIWSKNSHTQTSRRATSTQFSWLAWQKMMKLDMRV